MSFRIRDVAAADIEAVLDLNESAVPAVNSLGREEMGWFVENAAYFKVAGDDQGIAAFLIGLGPGLPYGSLNYQWFSRQYRDFAYVDRIAVAARARRSGLGNRLYKDYIASAGKAPVLLCEVNLRPPNEGSMQFHLRQGFRQVGSQETEGGSKEVALLEKTLG